MPLSEQEQRLLEEMERSLYQNDVDFVATVSPRRGRPNYTVIVAGVLITVVGIAVLVSGVIVRQPIVGVLGFAVMFAGVLLSAAPPRRAGSGSETAAGRPAKRPAAGSRFMDDLNRRWDRRQEERD